MLREQGSHLQAKFTTVNIYYKTKEYAYLSYCMTVSHLRTHLQLNSKMTPWCRYSRYTLFCLKVTLSVSNTILA